MTKLRGGAAAREGEIWAGLWATPQAVAWARLRWTRVVARYVRILVAAEAGDLDCAKEARQLEDRLGLNPLAMLRLRWEIATDEVGEQRDAQAESAAEQRVAAARNRLKVVDPGAVAGT